MHTTLQIAEDMIVSNKLTYTSTNQTPTPTIYSINRCGPCQMVAPHFAKMADDNPNAIFVKVDVDTMDKISQQCGVRAMPTFQFFKNGAKVDELMGANVDALKQKVAALAA